LDASIRFDHQLLALESEHDVHCMLELEVPAADADDRVPLRIALVIDRSGSMAGIRLDVAKQCATFLASHLKSDDSLALVAYDDEVQLVQALAPADPKAARAAIASIHPGGSTNLSGGWLKGLEELGRADDGIRRVLLLTDGHANAGITGRAELTSIAAGTKPQAATTTIGFGDGYDEDLLGTIADESGGATYYAADPDEAPAIFAEEFEGLTTLVVQNISVEIRPDPAVEFLGVLNDYPAVEVPGGVQVQIGDGYGGEKRRIAFRLHTPHLAQLGPMKLGEVVLRYVTVGEAVAAHETTIPVIVNLVSADDPAAQDLDPDVVDEVVLLNAARAKRGAMRLADEGQYDAARALLMGAAETTRKLAPYSDRAAELVTEADLLDGHVSMMSPIAYDTSERKRMHMESWRRSRGRKDRP
jgi:Ca-activated chloride channel family protein